MIDCDFFTYIPSKRPIFHLTIYFKVVAPSSLICFPTLLICCYYRLHVSHFDDRFHLRTTCWGAHSSCMVRTHLYPAYKGRLPISNSIIKPSTSINHGQLLPLPHFSKVLWTLSSCPPQYCPTPAYHLTPSNLSSFRRTDSVFPSYTPSAFGGTPDPRIERALDGNSCSISTSLPHQTRQ